MNGSDEIPHPRAEASTASALPSAIRPEDAAEPTPVRGHGLSPVAAPATSTTGSGPLSGTAGGTRRIRASNSEREATVRLLHRAHGDGRIDLAETEARVTAAYASVYRSDLPTLLADLPPEGEIVEGGLRGSLPPSWQELWVEVVWRARASLWDRPGLEHSIPPGAGQQRLFAALVAFTTLWLLLWAMIGAVL